MDDNVQTPEEIQIRSVAYPGRGVGNLRDGMVVFVPDTLPGETVSLESVHRRAHFAEGRVRDILTPAPQRVAAACPLAASGSCPGCAYQHVAYTTEVELKQAQLLDLLTRLGGLETDIRRSPVPSPNALSYRNKIELHVGRQGDDLMLGYVGHDNRTIIDVPQCPLAVEPINALLQRLRGDDTFVQSLHPGETVTFRYTPQDGPLFWRHGESLGPSQLHEQSVLGSIQVPRRSFYQINPTVADSLLTEVQTIVRQVAPQTVLDIYCGVGVFALAALAAGAHDAFGIDTDARAIRAARHNAQARGYHTQAEFVARDAFAGLRAVPARVRPEETLVIADPTRAGLDRDVLQLLGAVHPRNILYIACAADTLSRDVRLLREAGYTALSARLFDMFPRTSCFETLVHLTTG